MPPRGGGGFFRGVFRAIGDFLSGHPRETPRKPPPQGPPSGGGGGAPPRRTLDSRYQSTFRSVTGGSTGYRDWEDFWTDNYGFIFDGDEEKDEYFDLFLRAYYLSTTDPRHVTRDYFHHQSGIPTREMDWDRWRNLLHDTNPR